MGIQRYSASLDTTVANAYKMNLSTRATGSNMGLADTLEVFTIYGQGGRTTSELSRILVQFPTSSIATDRTSSAIPASGSVSFFLRMYNAEHSFTLPKDFSLNISAVSRSWEEGYGLDMDEYTDLTYDEIGANWIMAASGTVATLVDAINCANNGDNHAFTMTVPVAAGGEAGPIAHKFTFVANDAAVAALDDDTTNFGISRGTGVSDTGIALALVDAINGVANLAVGYAGGAVGTTLTAGTLGLTAAITAGETTKVTLTMDDTGTAGNVANVLEANTGFDEGTLLLITAFTGGGNDWTLAGGDYYSDLSSSFTASFTNGTEDLEVDITTLVEQWLGSTNLGSKHNYGVEIMFPIAQESAVRSYYTKKFFARSSQYYLKRPTIEARWDSTKKDSTSNFFLSSSLAPAEENLNTVYMYNNIRGILRDIPAVGTNDILVSIYNDWNGTTNVGYPLGSAYGLPPGGGVVSQDDVNITGSRVSAGVYSASFAYDRAGDPIFAIWHSASVQYHTSSAITVNTYKPANYCLHPDYVTKIVNLKDTYFRDEKTTKFRLHVREKNWNPNIYTKATTDVSASIIEDGYYRIYRTTDEFEVVAYGTGSTNHTRLSYDVSGSYFDFPMDVLEAGYMYAFKFLYKMPDGHYREQPEMFKFRVE